MPQAATSDLPLPAAPCDVLSIIGQYLFSYRLTQYFSDRGYHRGIGVSSSVVDIGAASLTETGVTDEEKNVVGGTSCIGTKKPRTRLSLCEVRRRSPVAVLISNGSAANGRHFCGLNDQDDKFHSRSRFLAINNIASAQIDHVGFENSRRAGQDGLEMHSSRKARASMGRTMLEQPQHHHASQETFAARRRAPAAVAPYDIHSDRDDTERRCAQVHTQSCSAAREPPCDLCRVHEPAVDDIGAIPVATGGQADEHRRHHVGILWSGFHHGDQSC